MSYLLPPDPGAVETAIAVNADAITANTTTINGMDLRITDVENNDLAQDATIATATSDIASNLVLINANTANITSNDGEIATAQADIIQNASDISTINGTLTAQGDKGAANGLCPLDGSAEVPMANIKNGVANGVADLDGSSRVPISQMPTTVYAGGDLNVNGGITQTAVGALSLWMDNGAGPAGTIEYIPPNSTLRLGYTYPEIHNGAPTSADYSSLTGTLLNFVADPSYFARFGRTYLDAPYLEAYNGSAAQSAKVHFSAADQAFRLDHSYLGNVMDIGENNATWTWRNIYGQNAYTTVSDEKVKTKIKQERKGLKFISKLKPRKWKKKDKGKRVHHGMVAQDVEELLKDPEFADSDGEDGFVCKQVEYLEEPNEDGEMMKTNKLRKNEDGSTYYNYALRYGEFIGPLICAAQELDTENKKLKEDMEKMKKDMKAPIRQAEYIPPLMKEVSTATTEIEDLQKEMQLIKSKIGL